MAISSTEYLLFKANLENKNDFIKTLQEHLGSERRHEPPSPSSVAKPELRISMSGANIFVPGDPDIKNRLTGIALGANIWNTGAEA